jgi:hypothetical protein
MGERGLQGNLDSALCQRFCLNKSLVLAKKIDENQTSRTREHEKPLTTAAEPLQARLGALGL